MSAQIQKITSTLSKFGNHSSFYMPEDARILSLSMDSTGYVVMHFQHESYQTALRVFRTFRIGEQLQPSYNKSLLYVGTISADTFNTQSGEMLYVYEEV